jgi:hypothetical protein
MKTLWWIGVVGAVLLALAVSAAFILWLGFTVAELPHDHIRIFIDGELIEIPPLTDSDWLVAALVIAFVAIVVLVTGMLLLVMSPLLLLGALVVWLWRRSARAQSPA